jgi:hypothetical protein
VRETVPGTFIVFESAQFSSVFPSYLISKPLYSRVLFKSLSFRGCASTGNRSGDVHRHRVRVVPPWSSIVSVCLSWRHSQPLKALSSRDLFNSLSLSELREYGKPFRGRPPSSSPRSSRSARARETVSGGACRSWVRADPAYFPGTQDGALSWLPGSVQLRSRLRDRLEANTVSLNLFDGHQ